MEVSENLTRSRHCDRNLFPSVRSFRVLVYERAVSR